MCMMSRLGVRQQVEVHRVDDPQRHAGRCRSASYVRDASQLPQAQRHRQRTGEAEREDRQQRHRGHEEEAIETLGVSPHRL